MLLCGYAAVSLLLGRRWFKRSNYSLAVGIAYPILAMLLALITLVTPLSQLLLWLGPVMQKGSGGEWIMLWFWIAASVVVLAPVWRGRMLSSHSFKEEFPVFLVLGGFHVSDLAFVVAGSTQIR